MRKRRWSRPRRARAPMVMARESSCCASCASGGPCASENPSTKPASTLLWITLGAVGLGTIYYFATRPASAAGPSPAPAGGQPVPAPAGGGGGGGIFPLPQGIPIPTPSPSGGGIFPLPGGIWPALEGGGPAPQVIEANENGGSWMMHPGDILHLKLGGSLDPGVNYVWHVSKSPDPSLLTLESLPQYQEWDATAGTGNGSTTPLPMQDGTLAQMYGQTVIEFTGWIYSQVTGDVMDKYTRVARFIITVVAP